MDALGIALRRMCQRRPKPATTLQHLSYRPAPPRLRACFPSTPRRRASNMAQQQQQPRSFPAYFCRGGTSNGLVILRRDLPADEAEWASILPAAMGSPDPDYGRQLDGMGSGVSSTSKICIISAPSPSPSPSDTHGGGESPAGDDVDVNFTFVQVGIRGGELDMAGNCGNMSSVVGPVALEAGLLDASRLRVVAGGGGGDEGEGGQRQAVVTIRNTNTGKLMRARFAVSDDDGSGSSPPRYLPRAGSYAMAGVPGTGSRVSMSFLDPAGAKTGRALPTRRAADALRLSDGSRVEASLVDVSNPGVFVRGSDLGLAAAPTPAQVEADAALRARLAEIRRLGAAEMGLDPAVESVPKVLMLFPPEEDGGDGAAAAADIRCVAMSMGQAHKAVPLTLALCLGAATSIPGTIPAQLARKGHRGGRDKGVVTIAHPGGTVDIGTTLDDNGEIVSAELHRTARILMKGDVYY
ncbi:uncharacterized protein E0L32_005735 [Thyridium curvatum]|uniref:Uncharacterized protein n=1 Tax=Thyridium curvatum TaxID=1093900 RepID=A0A507B9P8_9PEZI|nr:uncharacterized protein E0L32_005735 [Thyridium curvatum]TPX13791.1 hypothetical protein E0L32_005735 [Thyridium curvatum]